MYIIMMECENNFVNLSTVIKTQVVMSFTKTVSDIN